MFRWAQPDRPLPFTGVGKRRGAMASSRFLVSVYFLVSDYGIEPL